MFSQHGSLKKINITRHSRVAVAHFEYSTGDACGQNMVTSITAHLCKWILSRIEEELPQVKVTHYCVESGLSGDKSMTFTNLWRTRGHHVQAEAWVPEDVLRSVLKVCVEYVYRMNPNYYAYYIFLKVLFLSYAHKNKDPSQRPKHKINIKQ